MKPLAAALFVAIALSASVARAENTVFVSNNTVLEDTLELQHQMHLLRQLVAREKQGNELLQAGKNVGIASPVLNKPDRDLCASLPANIPCAQAYHELYTGFDVTSKPPTDTSENLLPRAMQSNNGKTKTVRAAATSPLLYWLDITCLESVCSALVSPDPQDRKSYQRIISGETIAGHVIESISASGVTARKNGKTIDIPPAPRG